MKPSIPLADWHLLYMSISIYKSARLRQEFNLPDVLDEHIEAMGILHADLVKFVAINDPERMAKTVTAMKLLTENALDLPENLYDFRLPGTVNPQAVMDFDELYQHLGATPYAAQEESHSIH